MGLLLLVDATGSFIMWAALLVSVALTVWEVRENGFSRKASLWWILFVLLTHAPGYLVLRGVIAYLRQRSQA